MACSSWIALAILFVLLAMVPIPERADIVFFGTAHFAVPILDALYQSPWRPSLVVTTPDEPAGRGKQLAAPPVKQHALEVGIPVIQPERLKPLPEELAKPRDLFIVAAYGKILPAELLAVPRCGALNIHPSLLPRWRGAAPIQATILSGDTETGVTIIAMDADMDHGPIVKSEKSAIGNPRITTPELSDALAEKATRLLLGLLPAWLAGDITPVPQDHAAATYTKLLRRDDGRIDWKKPAVEIERMIRAYQPWPGAFSFWQRNGEPVRLAIESGMAFAAPHREPAGTVIAVAAGADLPAQAGLPVRQAGVVTGSGVLVLERIRPAGSASMSTRDFLNGHKQFIGAHLG